MKTRKQQIQNWYYGHFYARQLTFGISVAWLSIAGFFVYVARGSDMESAKYAFGFMAIWAAVKAYNALRTARRI